MIATNFDITTVAAAGVATLFIVAPIASADDPPACAPDDQQCQEKQKNQGAGIANQVIDNVQQGVDQAEQVQNAIDPNTGKPYAGRPFHIILNGAEVCWAGWGTHFPLGPLRAVPWRHGRQLLT